MKTRKDSGFPFKVKFEVEAELMLAPDVSDGRLAMTIADTGLMISTPDKDGKPRQLGEAIAAMGGGIVLEDAQRQLTYGLSLKEVWISLHRKLDELGVKEALELEQLPEAP